MNAESITKRTRLLVDVAMGRVPADLVIRGGRWVCVQSGEIIPKTDIAIKSGRIAYVGPDGGHTIDTGTQVVEAEGKYLVPGLLDAHMHVESGMLTVTEFVRAVIPHGTTGMFIDPHEIANVFGMRGVRLMVDEAAVQPIHVWVQMPSCVPSAPGFETPGASIGPDEVAEAMSWDGIIGLGEVMNFPGVFMGDENMHAEMAVTRAAGKVIGGHYASPDLGLPFHAYAAGGPEDDHEGTRMQDAVMRVRQGMKAMLREGSAWKDVDKQVRAITEMKMDSRHFMLCTDDSHAETLVNEGHMDRVVKQAIQQGLAPITALQMATLNTAQHFGVAQDVGMIAPGRFADILLVGNLVQMDIYSSFARGRQITQAGEILIELPSYDYPDWVKSSVNLGRDLKPIDFRIAVEPPTSPAPKTIMANVIGVVENQATTRHLKLELPVVDGEIKVEIERDIAKIAIVERHKGDGGIQVGLVQGFGLQVPCAIGTTVAHDSHHMIVVGTDESDMATATQTLSEMGGGQVVIRQGQVIGQVELPIAGLMSDERAEIVARKAGSVLDGFLSCGCQLNNPNMQLSLLALVVIPELRISDLGLVDVTRFEFIPVLEY
ncbi:MAG: adenine deaminase [Anaerolineales bacterium]